MFETVLVANRGEIARRIIRSVQGLGLRAVAVYSEADESLPFVREADEAVLLGPAAPAQSYRNADALIEAAKQTGAQAVHPGYGFLAENAHFAARVRQVGPGLGRPVSRGDRADGRQDPGPQPGGRGRSPRLAGDRAPGRRRRRSARGRARASATR